MALVPHESSLNSNRTLAPSVCLGPQVGSSRVVPSGCSVGQVEVGVVTTVMVPSAEQTDTTDRHVRVVSDSGGQPIIVNVRAVEARLPIMSCVLKRQRLEVDVWTSRVLESLRTSLNVP